MKIDSITIYKYSIPMQPFTIATGTMDYAQNILITIFTDNGFTGYGECSAFPMITGESQNTCFEMAKDFARIWKGKAAADIPARMEELHTAAAFNRTIKSAFDMALYDLAAKEAALPLFAFLGGSRREMQTDITIGIGTPALMAAQAAAFVKNGASILKVKLGKDVKTDIERIRAIRLAVGAGIIIRTDANQGWRFEDAKTALVELGNYNIEFCEQPMRTTEDEKLPELIACSPVQIMADESVYDHYDAMRLIGNESCSMINIKFAKSGGIFEAEKIIAVAKKHQVPCMMGGMLESRLALTAFAHFAAANDQIVYYDMDTCLLGHTLDPVLGGVTYKGYTIHLPENGLGIGATVDQAFLESCISVSI
jgi:L-alanine-DL-glutamate epimerase-like enolase superfamily enzyme